MGERSGNRDAGDSIGAAARAFAEALDRGDPFVASFADAALPMAISDPNLPDNPIIHVNAAFERLTGYAPDEVVGRNCRFLQGPSTNAEDVARLATALRRREPVTVDLLNFRRDGTSFWNRLHVAPVVDASGALRFHVASQNDVTLERERLVTMEAERLLLVAEAEQARAALADSERRIQTGAARAFGSWARDPATDRLDASAGCKAIFGRGPDERFEHDDFVSSIHPEDVGRVMAAIAATEETGAAYDVEYRVVRPDGSERWVAARGELVRRRDGSPLSMNGFVTDVTDRRASDEQRQLVARELGHRIKNTLATVSAVVAQSLKSAPSLVEARRVVDGRIASLAAAHDLLIEGGTDATDLDALVRRALAPFDPEGARTTVSGGPVALGSEAALALSMTFHELATNAVKHGALSSPSGSIDVDWTTQPGAGALGLRWRERGGPPTSPPTTTGFGSQLMRRILSPLLAGPLRNDFEEEGLTFSVLLRPDRLTTG